jgi:hypothetical protein
VKKLMDDDESEDLESQKGLTRRQFGGRNKNRRISSMYLELGQQFSAKFPQKKPRRRTKKSDIYI